MPLWQATIKRLVHKVTSNQWVIIMNLHLDYDQMTVATWGAIQLPDCINIM